MKQRLVSLLCCPLCQGGLVLHSFHQEGEEVLEGVLACTSAKCGTWYPVVKGIPRLLVESLRQELTRQFVGDFRAYLVKSGVSLEGKDDVSGDDALEPLKKRTAESFGFEWKEYSRFGWDDPTYDLAREEQVFRRKSLLEPEEIRGKLVLDAGCGNGRYAYWAAKYGGEVVAMDLGQSVEYAFQNTRQLPNVHIVQGDIFKPPFGRVFDIIFSIGVLMHTGKAREAFLALASKLKPGGAITAHLYGKGNPVYEFVDATLRRKTTRMSTQQLTAWTNRVYKVSRLLKRLKLFGIANYIMRLDDHPHCIFDWYSAPIATHHTYAEVSGWLRQAGLKVTHTNEYRASNYLGRLKAALTATTVTVRSAYAV